MLTQSHLQNITCAELLIFNMSSFNDRFLLMKALVGANNKDVDEKINKYYSKLDNLIALIKNMIH